MLPTNKKEGYTAPPQTARPESLTSKYEPISLSTNDALGAESQYSI